jgi:tRNA U38,U39,U40 pseudouridine synthase TruA
LFAWRQIRSQVGLCQLRLSQNAAQQIVEVVSNASYQHPQTFKLLPGKCLFLGALDFGDVFDQAKAVEGFAFPISDNGCVEAAPNDLGVATLGRRLTHAE